MLFLNVEMNNDWNIYTALKLSIFGIGELSNKKIMSKLGIQKNFLLSDIENNVYLMKKMRLIEKRKKLWNLVELDLFLFNYYNIQSLINNSSYRGFCHKNGLPVRGQRTKTNGNTQFRLYRKRIYPNL